MRRDAYSNDLARWQTTRRTKEGKTFVQFSFYVYPADFSVISYTEDIQLIIILTKHTGKLLNRTLPLQLLLEQLLVEYYYSFADVPSCDFLLPNLNK